MELVRVEQVGPRTWWPKPDAIAVPVMGTEFLTLMAGIEAVAKPLGELEVHRYAARMRPVYLQRVGAARELGHPTMPVPVGEVKALRTVLTWLQLGNNAAEVTAGLARLVRLLEMRLGAAHIRGWCVRLGLAGWEWERQPASCAEWAGAEG